MSPVVYEKKNKIIVSTAKMLMSKQFNIATKKKPKYSRSPLIRTKLCTMCSSDYSIIQITIAVQTTKMLFGLCYLNPRR